MAKKISGIPVSFFEAMGRLNASSPEIAVQIEIQFGKKVDDSTVRRWLSGVRQKDHAYMRAYAKGREEARISLRRALWNAALVRGNVRAMLALAYQPFERGGLGFVARQTMQVEGGEHPITIEELRKSNPVVDEILNHVRVNFSNKSIDSKTTDN